MKRFILLAVIAVMTVSYARAQGKSKFGHVDSQGLLMVMPERQAALTTLQNYATELEETLADMQKEFEAKYADYLAKADSLSPFLRKNKEEELQLMNQRIEEFKTTANQDVQEKEAELLQPIIAKAKKAIEEVAKESGLMYVFDVAEGAGGVVVLYYSEDSMDILPLVKKKLGVE